MWDNGISPSDQIKVILINPSGAKDDIGIGFKTWVKGEDHKSVIAFLR
jgi:hypothetical protein